MLWSARRACTTSSTWYGLSNTNNKNIKAKVATTSWIHTTLVNALVAGLSFCGKQLRFHCKGCYASQRTLGYSNKQFLIAHSCGFLCQKWPHAELLTLLKCWGKLITLMFFKTAFWYSNYLTGSNHISIEAFSKIACGMWWGREFLWEKGSGREADREKVIANEICGQYRELAYMLHGWQ